MVRKFLLAALLTSLAACGQMAARAPAHPSQSQATSTGESRQIQISDANRTQVQTNIRDMLAQASSQFAQGAAPLAGMEDVVVAIQPGTDHQFPVSLQSGVNYGSSAFATPIAITSIWNCSMGQPAKSWALTCSMTIIRW